MPESYKQCAESQVNQRSFRVYNLEMYCEESQNYFRCFLNGELYDQPPFQDNFPIGAEIKNSEEMVSQEIQPNSSAKQTHLQPNSQNQFFPQLQDLSVSEELPQQQAVETSNQNGQGRQRKDAHALSQNVSSKARSLICKLLSRNKAKSFKKAINQTYTKFLKESGFTNSQVVLLFSYLFLMENRASGIVYAEFRHDFLEYLFEKKVQALKKSDEVIRDGLIAKIEANIRLVEHLFSLWDPQDLNFKQVQTICEPLFKGRQTKVIDKPLKKARQIYERIIASTIKTSNTSTGCQVEL